MISPERLADLFVEVADTLVDEFDLVDFLHNLVDHVADVTGASAVGLMLADQNGELHYMAASSEGGKHLELFQLQHDEGPCLDCFHSHAPVVVNDLQEAADRWPDFAPQALASGVSSVHAFPMRLRDRALGALNVFGEEQLPLEPSDVKVVQAMADIATISILQERTIADAGVLTEQLQGALNSRVVIEQAKGMVARQHGIGVEDAFREIRAHARSNHLHLVDLAADIVNGAVEFPRPDAR